MTSKPPSDFMKASLEAACSAYEKQLDEAAVQYLTNERGLSRETLEYFRVGYVADPSAGHEAYRGRISIPYITPSGIVSLRFRSLPGGPEPKIKGIAGIPAKKIFNTRDLYSTETIYICEGEIDAMTAHQCGLMAVGIAGVNNWNKDWWRIFRNRKVVVLADNDDAGQGAGMAEEIVQSLNGEVTTILMPGGNDVNSLVVTQGEAALLRLVGKDD